MFCFAKHLLRSGAGSPLRSLCSLRPNDGAFLLNRHDQAVILKVPKQRAAEAALNILLKFGF